MSHRSPAATADHLAFEDGILAPDRRAALVLNKAAILDALAADGVSTLSASFEGLPFGCYLENIEVRGPAGPRTLCRTRIRYASPGRKSRFRHRKSPIEVALADMIEDVLCDGWDSITALEGTVRIDVPGRAFTVNGRSTERQFQRVY